MQWSGVPGQVTHPKWLLGQGNAFGNLPVTSGIKDLAHVPELASSLRAVGTRHFSINFQSGISATLQKKIFFFQSKAESLTLVRPKA